MSIIVQGRRHVEIEGQQLLRRRGRDLSSIVVHDRGRGITVAVTVVGKQGRGPRRSASRVHRGGRCTDGRGVGGGPRPAGGLHGAAHAARGRPLRSDDVGIGERVAVIQQVLLLLLLIGEGIGEHGGRRGEWEVGLGLGTAEGAGGRIVGASGGVGGVECPQPHPGLKKAMTDGIQAATREI